MKDNIIVHALVGNDVSPWMVAAARGLLAAVIAGATGFFATWAQTDEVKLLVTAGFTPFLTVLTLRFLAEGVIDAGKQN